MTPPCKDCITLAVCKQKVIGTLFDDCIMITEFCRPDDKSFADKDGVYHTSKALGRFFIIQHKIDHCDYIVDIEKTTLNDLRTYVTRDEIELEDLLKLMGVVLPTSFIGRRIAP